MNTRAPFTNVKVTIYRVTPGLSVKAEIVSPNHLRADNDEAAPHLWVTGARYAEAAYVDPATAHAYCIAEATKERDAAAEVLSKAEKRLALIRARAAKAAKP